MRFVCDGRVATRVVLSLLLALAGSAAVAQDSPDSGSGVALRGVMIPTGFQGNKYSAMIQVAVAGSPLPDATWDLRASFSSGGGAPEEFSSRVVAREPGTPVVFEVQVEFAPGQFVLDLEARETTAGQSETGRLDDRWPDPATAPATISPVVLLQPAQGAFVRGDRTRGQGALAVVDDDPVRINLPTAIVTVVCRGAATQGAVRVERQLEGSSSVEFETIELSQGQEACAQVRDIIHPGTLGLGFFRYKVRLVSDSGEIASSVRKFVADDGS